MQNIPCPWCGNRLQTEFEYICDDTVLAQEWDGESPEEELDRVFLRDHHVGFHGEVWQHVLGCRGWLVLDRNNLTHEIRGSRPLGRGEAEGDQP